MRTPLIEKIIGTTEIHKILIEKILSEYEKGQAEGESINITDSANLPMILRPQGPKGEQGESGFSPTITEKINTDNEYVLTITNKNGSFNTPNLKPNIPNIIEFFYPIGRGFIDFTDTDYSNYLGFTWERELIGMFPVGYNPNDTDFDTIGKTGGEKKHTLTINEIPPHNHGVTIVEASNSWGPSYTNGISHKENTKNVGGGQPHNNLPPYKVVSYWKRVS